MRWLAAVALSVAMIGGVAIAQEAQESAKEAAKLAATADDKGAKSQEPSKAAQMSPTTRLLAAKTIYVKKGSGSDIPETVIISGLEGWGKYQEVDSPQKADLLVEITAPGEGSGVSISSSTGTGTYGKQESSTKTTKELPGSSMVTMTVYDAKNRVPLWRGTEQAKSAMKQKARQDNLVEAAQKLLTKFRDRVEPVK